MDVYVVKWCQVDRITASDIQKSRITSKKERYTCKNNIKKNDDIYWPGLAQLVEHLTVVVSNDI